MLDVMIVDDDALIKEVLKRLINWEEIGARVVASLNDGTEAVEFLKQNHIDLVISDIKMPMMDGLELTEYISNNCLGTKVILLSAYGEFEYAKLALKYNVMAYLLKPINKEAVEELSQLIKSEGVEKENLIAMKKLIHSSEFKERIGKFVSENYMDGLMEVLEIQNSYVITDMNAIREYYSVVIDCVLSVIGKSIADGIDKSDMMDSIFKISDANKLKEYIGNKLREVMRIKQVVENNNVHMFAQYISDYIAREYRENNMNAGSVAERFKITTTYLSYIFKKEFGIPVSQYIIGLFAKAFFVDSVIESLNTCKYFIVITTKRDDISNYIIETLHHGVTVNTVMGEYTKEEKTMIHTVCKRTEAIKLRSAIKQIDPYAFTIITTSSEIIGRGFRSI